MWPGLFSFGLSPQGLEWQRAHVPNYSSRKLKVSIGVLRERYFYLKI
jgi:hypothetical protein